LDCLSEGIGLPVGLWEVPTKVMNVDKELKEVRNERKGREQ
jgi:hypothetical protein